MIVTHSLITQTLFSHAGLPTFETLSLNPNGQMREEKPGTASGNRHCFTKTVCVIYDKTVDVYTVQQYAVQFCQRLSFTVH